MVFSERNYDSYGRNELFPEKSSIIQSQEEKRIPSDKQLVIQAQAGDKVAFDLLYERYYYQIYRFQTRMTGDSWLGEDLAQETLLKAWRALAALRDPTKFPSWLYRIATNEAFNHYRLPDVRSQGSYDQQMESLKEVSISGPQEQVEAQERLQEALAQISPEKCRACLILYHIDEYSIPEIAEFLGIKQSSVRQYASSGLNQLKRLLEEEDTSKEEK